MINFFHKLLNPHCPECKEEQEDKKFDIAIETLKSELAAERYNNQLLINALLPKQEQVINQVEVPQEINKRNLPWRVRQQMLEAEDRAKAQTLRRNKEEMNQSAKSTEQLEKELLGEKMPNLVTVAGTGVVGPGLNQPSKQFSDIINLNVDFVEQTLTLFRSGGQQPIILDYNVFTTVTWTVSAHLATVSFS